MKFELIVVGVVTTVVVATFLIILYGPIAAGLALVGMFGVLMTCVGAEAAPKAAEVRHRG